MGQADLQPQGDQERASPQPPGPVPSGPSNERGLWRLASRNPEHMAPGAEAPPSGIQGAQALGSELGGLPHKVQAASGLPPYPGSAHTPYWLSRALAAGSGGSQGGPVTCAHCPPGQGLGLRRTALGEGPHPSRRGRGGAECDLETPARALPLRGGLCGPRASVLHQGLDALVGAGLDALVGAGRKLVPSGPQAQKKRKQLI